MERLTVLTWRVPRASAAEVEAATLPAETDPGALVEIAREAGAAEAVYVPTCQRVVYALLDAPEDAPGRLAQAYARRLGRAVAAPEVFRGEPALHHLAETASSLDSLVVGEPQVLGQFKEAARASETLGAAGPGMRHVMSLVFRAAKAVRAETGLFEGKVSLVPLTEALVRRHLEGVPAPSAAVVGTGQVGRKMVELLRQQGVETIHVVSRDGARAAAVAQQVGATPLTLDELLMTPPEGLDVVALALHADAPVLRPEHLERLASGRRVLVLDLAMPRNVEAPAGEIPNLSLVQMDDLARLRDEGVATRAAELDRAREVLDREVAQIRSEYEERKLAHDLRSLAARFAEVSEERWAQAPPGLDAVEARKWYEQTVRALLHEATAAVKKAGCRERDRP